MDKFTSFVFFVIFLAGVFFATRDDLTSLNTAVSFEAINISR